MWKLEICYITYSIMLWASSAFGIPELKSGPKNTIIEIFLLSHLLHVIFSVRWCILIVFARFCAPSPPLRLSKVVSRQHRSIPNSSRGYRISLNTHFFKLTRRFNSIVTFLKMIVWLFNIVDSFQIFYKYFVLKFVLTPLNSILGHLLKGLSWLFCVYCSHLFQIHYCIKKWGVKRNHQTCPTGKT